MGERTEYPPGAFSWTDLATSDAEAATAFYTGLFGWEADTPRADAGGYTMLRVRGFEVAALYPKQAEEAPSAWLTYVTVASADEAAARARELGATALSEAFDVLDVGRMAVLQDPQGAVFAVWEPRKSIGARLVNDPGAMCMTQLIAADRTAAMRFYAGLFGWRFEQVSQEPPFFSVFNGERLNAGMMDRPAGDPSPSSWLVYFTVEDADAAVASLRELGGALAVGPMDVPAGRIAVAQDPQGAWFGLFAGEVDP